LLPNSQIQSIITWFERQRAYRAEIWRIEETAQAIERKESISSALDLKDSNPQMSTDSKDVDMQEEIDKMIEDWTEKERLQAEVERQKEEQEQRLRLAREETEKKRVAVLLA